MCFCVGMCISVRLCVYFSVYPCSLPQAHRMGSYSFLSLQETADHPLSRIEVRAAAGVTGQGQGQGSWAKGLEEGGTSSTSKLRQQW